MKNQIVSREEWSAQRAAMLKKEKAMTKARDALTAEIRSMPWVKIDSIYTFQTTGGPKTFLELFEGKQQLVVQHLMLGTAQSKPCACCSFWADQMNGVQIHLPARDTSFKVVSRAPLETILEWKRQLGWQFDWLSSNGSTFNYDFGVTSADHKESPGYSIFYRDGNDIYQTYFTTGRGLEPMNPTYSLLDLAPKGRDESQLEYPMAWVKRNNEYAK